MPETNFGPNQIGKPTPKFATYIFRAVLYILAIVALGCNTFSAIPADVKKDIMTYALEGILFTHGLTRMFGIKLEDDPTAGIDGNQKG